MKEKVKIDKMECRYPTLFKVMWCATVVWLLVMLAYLAVNKNDQILVNVMVVVIAGAFLYDIWRLADFQEEQFQWGLIGKAAECEE